MGDVMQTVTENPVLQASCPVPAFHAGSAGTTADKAGRTAWSAAGQCKARQGPAGSFREGRQESRSANLG